MNKTHSLGPEKKRTPNADQLINRGLTVSGCLAPCLGVSMTLNLVLGLPREEEGFVGLVRGSWCKTGRIQRARAPV